MFLLIDNYDSFTYNLVQAFQVLGQDPQVLKNDDLRVLGLAREPALTQVCFSPGPGRPQEAGYSLDFLKVLDKVNPLTSVLGVCLGHQILGLFGGGDIIAAERVFHGRFSQIHHNGQGLFRGLPDPFEAGRYHSLLVEKPAGRAVRFEISAQTTEAEIMGLAFTDRPWAGVQFHPESIMTPDGLQLLANFFKFFAVRTK
ncbi:MAG: anthranilate synthase subunit II [Candidatus Adiutrix intracellularis]|nr:MAG: anthranilate synthase subunit II [Candidatus Adiutrix intracellularis]